MKRKICVTTGTRAEYGLLRPILYEIKKSRNLELILIITGMHLSKKHGNTNDFIKKDGFKTVFKFEMFPKKDNPYNMAITLGQGVINFSKVFEKRVRKKDALQNIYCPLILKWVPLALLTL